MKIIQALKNMKMNEDRVAELGKLIAANSARLSNETSQYDKPSDQVTKWLDEVRSLVEANEKLMHRVHKTNVLTDVTIEIGGKNLTKSIDEWLTRRRKGSNLMTSGLVALTDRKLKETAVVQSDGTRVDITIIRHFDAAKRDEVLSVLRKEPFIIDSTLEVINATTDIVE